MGLVSGWESGLDGVVERCRAMQAEAWISASLANRRSSPNLVDVRLICEAKQGRELEVAAIEFAAAALTVQVDKLRCVSG